MTHFAGKRDNAPHFETYEEPVNAVIEENDETVSFTSGKLTARVQKGENWRVDYVAEDGRVLTSSAFRGVGRALDKDTGKTYMSDSLMLDVGECVYGLGERFAAYVKNGQIHRHVERRRRHRQRTDLQEYPLLYDQSGLWRASWRIPPTWASKWPVKRWSRVQFSGRGRDHRLRRDLRRHAQGGAGRLHRPDRTACPAASVELRPVAVHVLHHQL